MATLAQLHQGVQSVLASKRLGKALFVRYHLQGLLEAEGATLAALASVGDVVSEWIGHPAESLLRLSSREKNSSHLSLTLRYPDGATAVVSQAQGVSSPRGAQLMVLGNRGALYHHLDGASLHHWANSPASLTRSGAGLLEALEAAGEKGLAEVAVKKPGKRPDSQPPGKPPAVKPRYGVLLVTGSHTHQENYAAAFAADPRCKLIALTDEKNIDARRRRLNERLARELGIPYIEELAEALKRDDVHIVSICAEPDRRGPIAVQCAKAGKHLYLDKSLVPSLTEADALRETVQKAKVKSHMFTFVSQPWAAEARKILSSNRLGKLLAIHADCFFAKGENGNAKLGTPRKEESPPRRHQLVEAKREFDNVGVYPITLIHWLTGKKFTHVHGVTGNYFFAEHQKHDVEDFGLLTGTLEGDLPVTVAAGRFGWTSHPAGGVNQLLLVGSEGTALIDANRPRLEVSANERPWTPPNTNPEDPMGFWSSTMAAVHLRPKTTWVPLPGLAASDVAHFLDRLDAGQDSDMSVTEAAHAAEVLLATYLSASKGEAVTLPLRR